MTISSHFGEPPHGGPAPTPTVEVAIPGTFTATYSPDGVIGWTFVPAASNAGYFGPSAVVYDYDDTEDDDGAGLDVEDVAGPFWKAVQAALAESNPIPVTWVE